MQRQAELPDAVLQAALQWAVTLRSGTAGAADWQAFAVWLEEDAVHQTAWRRVQALEQEFTRARDSASARQALDRVARNRQRKRRYTVIGGVLAVVLAVGLVLDPTGLRHWGADYVTGTGERQRMTLPGGAELHLNAATALDVERRTGRTLVHLYRGEIHIDSAAAPAGFTPRVHTTDGHLVPVGTRFVVRKTNRGTELAVTAGAVALHAPPARTEAKALALARPGQGWRLQEGRASPIAPSGLRPEAWIEGVVEADDAPLGRVLEALARHRHGWLRYDAAVAQLRVSGVFRLDDTDSALRALEQSLPIRIERTTDWWVTIEAAGAPP